MKKILFFFFIIFHINAQAQNSFETNLGTSLYDDLPLQIIETKLGEYVVNTIQCQGLYKKHIQEKIPLSGEASTKLYKLNLLGTKTQEKEFTHYNIYGIQEKNNLLFCYGLYTNLDSTKNVFMMYIDQNFNIVTEKRYRIPAYYSTDIFLYGRVFIQQDSMFYCIFNRMHKTGTTFRSKAFYYIVNQNIDSITSGNFQGYVNIDDIQLNSKKDGFLILGDGFQQFTGQILVQKTVAHSNFLFNISKVDSIPLTTPCIYLLNTNIRCVNNRIFVAGHPTCDYNVTDIGIAMLDTSFKLSAFHRYGNANKNNFYPLSSGLCIDSKKNAYIVATTDYAESYYNNSPSGIMLVKSDSLLNNKWINNLGNDAYYVVCDMNICSDNGCIIAATRFDYNSSRYDVDSYIIKLDTAGNYITSIPNTPAQAAKILSVRTSENSGLLKICTPIKYQGGVLQLVDIFGRCLCTKRITATETEVSVSHLTTGIYFYRYILDNQNIDSGKWLKK